MHCVQNRDVHMKKQTQDSVAYNAKDLFAAHKKLNHNNKYKNWCMFVICVCFFPLDCIVIFISLFFVRSSFFFVR